MMIPARTRTITGLFVVLLTVGCASTSDDLPQTSEDGLSKVDARKVDVAYVNPDADFSQYDEVYISNVEVAFKANWLRDQNRNRTRTTSRITQEDADAIRASMAQEFTRIFTDELQKGGYQVVSSPAEATDAERLLKLVPAIVDLDVTAPDKFEANRSRSYTTSAGSMTLNLEFHDALSGELLGRITDSQEAFDSSGAYVTRANTVSNRAEADRMLRRWASLLVDRLDEVHGK